MNKLTEDQLRKEAQNRVDFKRHLLVFILVNSLLWVIWALTGAGYPWPIWATGGWGIGLVFHAINTFKPVELFSVEKEMDELRKKNTNQ